MPVTQELSPFDPETCSLEELKARINNGETAPTEKTEPKRNADGTFAPNQPAQKTVLQAIQEQEEEETPVETEEVEEEEEQPEEKIIYQRKIDLGDGSGVQVFRADSMEELVDKLVVAQENATRKIRQMAANQPKPVVKKTRTADEEFALSQEFQSKPSQAFAKIFEEEVGMPISEFKSNVEAVKAFNATKAADAAAVEFVNTTPDYNASVENGKKMQGYLKAYNLPATVENLVKAFTELTAEGLLKPKPAPKTETTEVTTETPVEEVTPTVPRPQRKSSGLSARGGASPRPIKQGPSEDELYAMPLNQLRNLANKQAAGVKKDYLDF